MAFLNRPVARTIYFLLAVVIVLPLAGYTEDLSAPTVTLSLVAQPPTAGEAFPVSARVTDDQKVSRVLLHYRQTGKDTGFNTLPMQAQGRGDLFKAVIPASAVVPPGVDYFVEAMDAEGNVSQEPFPTHPRVLALSGGRPVESKSGTKWLWVIAGVLAVGAIAASGGSSGGGGSGDRESETGPTLTVTGPVP